MQWTTLRSCYKFPMRIYIGGQELIVPARWYFCRDDAPPFPWPHGCEASPWLKNYERNDDWGEVTPFPTDRDAAFSRTLDRGLNPGYPGLCYVGDPQWFRDGMLPAGILDGDPPPFPPCCQPGVTTTSGGLVLGGTATVRTGQRALSSGGIVLGGTGIAGPVYARSAGGLVLGGSALTGPARATSSGGIVLGGAGAGRQGVVSTGGLVLGGSALATRGGGIVTSCCPELPVPIDLTWRVTPRAGCGCFAGDFRLSYDAPSHSWRATGYGPCGVPPVVILGALACSPTVGWILSGDGGLFFYANPPSSVDCTAEGFRLTWLGVSVSGACTGTVDFEVTY